MRWVGSTGGACKRHSFQTGIDLAETLSAGVECQNAASAPSLILPAVPVNSKKHIFRVDLSI